MGRRQIIFIVVAIVVILVVIGAGLTYTRLTFNGTQEYTYNYDLATNDLNCNTPASGSYRIILDRCTPFDSAAGNVLTFFEDRVVSDAEFTFHTTETASGTEFACLTDPDTNTVFWVEMRCGIRFDE